MTNVPATGHRVSQPARPFPWAQVGVIVVTSALISALHATTSTHHAGLHALYEYLYYVPILMGAYSFGALGGLSTALFCALLYVPHIRTSWADNPPYAASQYGEIVAFHLVGGIVGLLVGRLRRSTDDARRAAEDLATKNRELMESAQHLTRAERLSSLGTLAAGLAHEVRTPITAVKGALDILADRARPGTPEAEFTGVAVRELSRLETLLEEFLAYARPSPPSRAPIQVRDIIRQVEALLSTEANTRDVRLASSTSVAGNVIGDAAQLTQVLVNIVMNAVQASPPRSTVGIELVEENGQVEIRVTDEGSGLSAEASAHLFEPFFTTKSKGTGLGLPIAQRIIVAHEGTLTLDAAEPRGTRATVRLPAAHAEAKA